MHTHAHARTQTCIPTETVAQRLIRHGHTSARTEREREREREKERETLVSNTNLKTAAESGLHH